jgi:hypothetical protein
MMLLLFVSSYQVVSNGNDGCASECSLVVAVDVGRIGGTVDDDDDDDTDTNGGTDDDDDGGGGGYNRYLGMG